MPATGHRHHPGDTPLTGAALRGHLADQHGIPSAGDDTTDRATHTADHQIASRRLAHDYERVRVSASPASGAAFQRCVRCRALLEDVQSERAAHDDFHARLGDPAVDLADPAHAADW